MKRYLTLFFLLITSIALCAYPEGAINNIDGSVLGWDDGNQVWRPIAVSEEGKLATGDNPAVASISLDTSSIDSKLMVDDMTVADIVNNIASDVKRNITETLYTERKSISASTATSVGYLKSTPATGDHRTFLELRAVDPNAEFYIGVDDTVTDSTGRPVKGRILINIDYSQNIYIYHTGDSALAIQQTEGWN